MKTAKEILIEWLNQNGYDGLYGDECGCFIDDLIPCGDAFMNCRAGVKIKAYGTIDSCGPRTEPAKGEEEGEK